MVSTDWVKTTRYNMRREAFKFWDLVRLILETLRYVFWIENISVLIKISLKFVLMVQIYKNQYKCVYWLGTKQAPNHHRKQWWRRTMTPYGVTRPQWFKYKTRDSLIHWRVTHVICKLITMGRYLLRAWITRLLISGSCFEDLSCINCFIHERACIRQASTA